MRGVGRIWYGWGRAGSDRRGDSTRRPRIPWHRSCGKFADRWPVEDRMSKSLMSGGERGASATKILPSPPRPVVDRVSPRIDCGKFPIKRVVGQEVEVEADVFAEGHDEVRVLLKYRAPGDTEWAETRMAPRGNDLWTGSFVVERLGRYEYTVEAWTDRFGSWVHEVRKKSEARQDVTSELLEGTELVRQGARRARGEDAAWLERHAAGLGGCAPMQERVLAGLDAELFERMGRVPDRSASAVFEPALEVVVDPERALFGSWYECFPRSCANEPGRHGTLRDLEARLPYVADMGFDVLYLPPIHPIGRSFRKGPNNTLNAGPGDPGSPWAIGSEEGGHTAILPELGTLEDFERLVVAAGRLGIQIALDIAFQCAPEHPWVKEHPEWFRHRPDGSIKYAENPPKKYQDIYPLEFEGPGWESLWQALLDVFLFWADRGVTIFRVDNPHTKPFRFWDWCIGKVKERYPEAIFLSEAFTRPKMMKRLAKGGFTQSYTYFTWRNHKKDLAEYVSELVHGESSEYMRPNFFANTPDILNEYLQVGGRPAFQIRAVLASMLSATYGIYGPPFEQCVGAPVKQGSEEYKDSEKYQLRHWNLDAPGNLRDFLRRLNRARRAHRCLQRNDRLWFCDTDNQEVFAFTKFTADLKDVVLTIVNMNPFHGHGAWVKFPLGALGLDPNSEYEVHDLLTDARYLWRGEHNFVMLDPHVCPAHVFHVRHSRSENDFDAS